MLPMQTALPAAVVILQDTRSCTDASVLNLPPPDTQLLGAGEGVITYMRTDGVAIGAPAVQEIREKISATYGKEGLAAEPRVYRYVPKHGATMIRILLCIGCPSGMITALSCSRLAAASQHAC